jgi:excisionase family DNA binding protein
MGPRMTQNPDSPERRERTVLINEAAELLGVSRRTIYYRIGDGRLQTIRTKCGSQRVLMSSIEALLREAEARERALGFSGDSGVASQTEPLALQVETLSRNS